MKTFFKILVFIIIPIAALYCFLYCFHIIEEDNFGIVEYIETGEAVRILNSGYHIVPEGAIPKSISVITVRKKNTLSSSLNIPLPNLEELHSNYFAIKIPVSIIYEIDPDKLSIDTSGEKNKKLFFNTLMEKALTGYFGKEMSSYFSGFYNKRQLLDNLDKILFRVENSIRNHMNQLGISISDFKIQGNIQLPEEKVYSDGLKQLEELIAIEKDNKKELLLLQNKLEKNNISRENYYKKLREISKIIRQNPDMLKYIYIDKLADNVKIVVSPENHGLPFGLDLNSTEKRKNEKGEIDNLR